MFVRVNIARVIVYTSTCFGFALPDYPACLSPYLHRKIWTSTLQELDALFASDPTTRIFVKPAASAKVRVALHVPVLLDTVFLSKRASMHQSIFISCVSLQKKYFHCRQDYSAMPWQLMAAWVCFSNHFCLNPFSLYHFSPRLVSFTGVQRGSVDR